MKGYLICGWLYFYQHVSLKSMGSSYNYFSQFSDNLTKSKLIKQVWSCKPMWHRKYSVILESKGKFNETFKKMSKYENSVFPYSLHSIVNLPTWRPKDTNVTLMYFLLLFTETLTSEIKSFFSKLYDKYCQYFQNLWGILNIPFCDVITKIRTFLLVTSC